MPSLTHLGEAGGRVSGAFLKASVVICEPGLVLVWFGLAPSIFPITIHSVGADL